MNRTWNKDVKQSDLLEKYGHDFKKNKFLVSVWKERLSASGEDIVNNFLSEDFHAFDLEGY